MLKYPYREKEIDELRKQLWLSQNDGSRMSVVYGRHFLGKSALVAAALEGSQPTLWLSLGGKNDCLALEEYKRHCSRKLGIFVPHSISSLNDLVNFLFDEAWKRPFSLVLDNFHEVSGRAPELCRYLARKWKSDARHTRMNLVLVCSDLKAAESMLFAEDAPLRRLAGVSLHIDTLDPDTVKVIQRDAAQRQLTNEDILYFYLFTGGRPEAIRSALNLGAVTKDELIEAFVKEDSALACLCEKELLYLTGKNSDTYISILQLVATGIRSQAEIEQALGGIITGGHLARLETEYQLLCKQRPVLSSRDSRGTVRYHVTDPSIAMLMRLRYADGGMSDKKEAETILHKYFKEDLRDYLIQKFIRSGLFTTVGSDWAANARISKKKGKVTEKEQKALPENHIDIVAVKGKKIMVAAATPSADDFHKEPFFAQIEAMKNGPLKGYSIDARLFTISDL